eukprot:8517873-Prorocentrum_lima.AAC.1
MDCYQHLTMVEACIGQSLLICASDRQLISERNIRGRVVLGCRILRRLRRGAGIRAGRDAS